LADFSKLAADSELSVKNGAELLDRLVKDIVAESASSYVSILNYSDKLPGEGDQTAASEKSSQDLPTAFSLARFIPLLQERIHVINPFTRTFLVSWLTLLDTIPDLELVYYLPEFLGGLFKFLSDPNRDVSVATQGLLERFLNEIKKIAKIKRGLADRRAQNAEDDRLKSQVGSVASAEGSSNDNAIADSEDGTEHDHHVNEYNGDWIPGQDVQVDHAKILDILLLFVDVSANKESTQLIRMEGLTKQKEEEIGIVALRWIDSFFEISPEDILQFVPRLLSQVLPALSAQSDHVRTTAGRVNRSLMDYIVTFQDDASSEKSMPPAPSRNPAPSMKVSDVQDRKQSLTNAKPSSTENETQDEGKPNESQLTPRSSQAPSPHPVADLDYAAAVSSLTLQFLNEHEATRVAALGWLIMLHRKAPKKVLAFNDGTFPALLKTLSDPSEAVVTRDLQLLSQISKNSEDSYFTSFMVNLLQLFSTDRKLLEVRGNLIIRQLCMNLMPERIYRTLADCLEKDEDIEFASIMVQNLNNNLITAPELADLRKRLRNLDSKDGQMFFVALFRSWCHNAVATFSLCLLAQAYEQAYNLLQIFAELEMTVNMLIQIDKLVQLLESPVFTYLRLQLLEPDRYPYLYKCLYGLLMLLPQSSAFGALKNRLNSVSAIGLLHTPPSTMPSTARGSAVAGMTTAVTSGTPSAVGSGYTGRLGKSRDGAGGDTVKWSELLEKFRTTQEKARKRNQMMLRGADSDIGGGPLTRSMFEEGEDGRSGPKREKSLPEIPARMGSKMDGGGGLGGAGKGDRPASAQSGSFGGGAVPPRPGTYGATAVGGPPGTAGSGVATQAGHKSRSSLGNFSKFASGIGGGRHKTKK
jgi:hypothetical protein